MMKSIKVSFYINHFASKPKEVTAAMLNTIKADKAITINHDSIKPFATLVGAKGCTFCPATFIDGKRSKDTFGKPNYWLLTLTAEYRLKM